MMTIYVCFTSTYYTVCTSLESAGVKKEQTYGSNVYQNIFDITSVITFNYYNFYNSRLLNWNVQSW